jgi:hypothetical protein
MTAAARRTTPLTLREYFAGAASVSSSKGAPPAADFETLRGTAAPANGAGNCQVVNLLATPAWDEWVLDWPAATVFHTSAWAAVLADTYGFQASGLVCPEQSGRRALLPVMECSSPITGRRGVALPFSDHVAPLAECAADSRALFEAALALGRARGWRSVEFRGGFEELGQGDASSTFLGHTLDLREGEQALFGRFDGSVRQAVRKAARAGVEVRRESSWEAVVGFYDLHCQTRRSHGLPPQPVRFFRNIHRHLIARGAGWVFTAHYCGRPLAAALFLHAGRVALYKFGASDRGHLELRANNAVMWEAIRHYAGQGFATLDFGRTSPGQEGLRRFKQGWATVEKMIAYGKYDLRRNGFATSRDHSSGWHAAVFRRLPVPVLRWLGERLYPHLS